MAILGIHVSWSWGVFPPDQSLKRIYPKNHLEGLKKMMGLFPPVSGNV